MGSGTNQEKMLIEWSKENEKAGLRAGGHQVLPERQSDTYLALQSGRIDALPRPQPDRRLPCRPRRQDRDRRHLLRRRRHLQGLIAATTKKDSGLASRWPPRSTSVIENGTYAKVLKRWGLSERGRDRSRRSTRPACRGPASRGRGCGGHEGLRTLGGRTARTTWTGSDRSSGCRCPAPDVDSATSRPVRLNGVATPPRGVGRSAPGRRGRG